MNYFEHCVQEPVRPPVSRIWKGVKMEMKSTQLNINISDYKPSMEELAQQAHTN